MLIKLLIAMIYILSLIAVVILTVPFWALFSFLISRKKKTGINYSKEADYFLSRNINKTIGLN